MSTDVKVRGALTFASLDDLAEAAACLEDEDEDDEAVAEVRELVEAGMTRKKTTVTVEIDGHLTANANLVLQDWIEALAGSATSGHLDTWQESQGDSYVRVHAGGGEEAIDEPFPA